MAVLLVAPVAQATERGDLLLEEVRGLRRDLHAVAVIAQRIQLLVYRMQVQAEVTRRAKESYDAASQALSQAEFDVTVSTGSVRKTEEQFRSESNSERKRVLESNLEELKQQQTETAAELAKQQSDTAEARRNWEVEQAKLEALQSRLDQLERQLEGLSAMLAR